MLAPGTPHAQPIHPAHEGILWHVRVAFGHPGNLIAIRCQKPERRVESFAWHIKVHPVLKRGGNEAPMILEGILISFIESMIILTGDVVSDSDPFRPLWGGWRFCQIDFHPRKVTYQGESFLTIEFLRRVILAIFADRECDASIAGCF